MLYSSRLREKQVYISTFYIAIDPISSNTLTLFEDLVLYTPNIVLPGHKTSSTTTQRRCVASVNELRKSLHATEQELTEIRSEKTKSSEKLVLLMADYESKKREKLQKIEELIDGGTEKSKPSKQQVHFGGF